MHSLKRAAYTQCMWNGGGGEEGGGSEKAGTLWASLSGTFLQTLPELVTPLRDTLYLRAAVQRRGQRPPKGSGTDKTVEAT